MTGKSFEGQKYTEWFELPIPAHWGMEQIQKYTKCDPRRNITYCENRFQEDFCTMTCNYAKKWIQEQKNKDGLESKI